MANVRDLTARFVAQAQGFKSTVQGMKKELNGLQKTSKDASRGMSRNFSGGAEAIQSTVNKISDGFTNFGDKLGNASQKVEDVGWSLTKKLTAPAVVAMGAIGGLVAKMGWDRLVSIDVAKAQLEGLGYSAKEQGSIIDTVTTAIQGGMTTMGDGIMIAAGGLAAGVKEGKDLEKYIRLVGDSAVGAKRPVDEMAQIFNRVVGGGRLMTRELNMIEHGMPGFAKAMAKHYGISVEAFRDMVTDGKVNSDDFLIVMEDFAGGMAEAYSKTWPGMVENTKAYVAILGELMMGGVFEKSKESIAEFIELLDSEKVRNWAVQIGKSLAPAFDKMVNAVKNTVLWFSRLTIGQQKMILGVGTFLVALGPVLILIGRIGSGVAMLSKGIGTFGRFVAKAITPIKSITKAFPILGKTVGATSTTFGVLLGWIALFVVAIVGAWKYSEPFRKSVKNLGNSLKELWNRFKEIITPMEKTGDEMWTLKDMAKNLWNGFKGLSEIIFKIIGGAFALLLNNVTFIVDGFIAMLAGVSDFVNGFRQLMQGNFKGALNLFKQGVRKTVGAVLDVWGNMFKNLWNLTKKGFNNIIVPFGDGLGNMIVKASKWSLDLALAFLNGLGNVTVSFIKAVPKWTVALSKGLGAMLVTAGRFTLDLALKFLNGLGDVTVSFIKAIPRWALAFANGLGEISVTVGKWLLKLPGQIVYGLGSVTIFIAKGLVKWSLAFVKGLGAITISIAKGITNWTLAFVKGLGTITIAVAKWAYEKLPKKIKDGLVNAVTVIGDKLEEWKDKFKEKTKEITLVVYNWALDLPGNIKKGFIKAKDNFLDWFDEKGEDLGGKLETIKNDSIEWAKDLPGKIKTGLGNGKDVFDKWLLGQHEENKKFYGGLGEKAGGWLSEKADNITTGLATWGVKFYAFFSKLPGKIAGHAFVMWTKFSEGFLDKKEKLEEKLAEWGTAILLFFTEMPGKIASKAFLMWTKFSEGFLDKKDAITKKLGDWNTAIVDFFNDMPGTISTKAKDMWTKFYDGFIDKKDALLEGLTNWTDGIKEWFTGSEKDVEDGADGLGERFIKTIKDKKDDIVESFTDWKDGIIDWFKNLGEDDTGEVKKSGKGLMTKIGEGLADKETQDSVLSKVGKFILLLPLYIIATGGVLLFAVGREFLRFIGKGMIKGKEILDDVWDEIQVLFSENSDQIIERLESNWLGKMLLSISRWGYDADSEFTNIWSDIKDVFTKEQRTTRERLESNFLGRMLLAIYDWDAKKPFKDAWSDIKDVFTQEQRTIRSRLESNFLGKMLISISEWGYDADSEFTNIWDDIKDVFTKEQRTTRERLESNWLGRMFTSIYDWGVDVKESVSGTWADIKRKFVDKMEEIRVWFEKSWINKLINKFKDFKKDFKGENSTMWADVKKKFTDKMDEIRAWFEKSWLGKMLSKAKTFKKDFKKNFSTMWADVKKKFTDKMDEIKAWFEKSWIAKLIKKARDFKKDFKKTMSDMWADIKKKFTEKMTEIRKAFENSWLGKLLSKAKTFKKDFKKNISTMWSDIKRNFSNRMSDIRRSFENSFVGKILASGKTLKKDFVQIAKDMWDGVKEQFNKIVTGAKNLPGRIGKGIKKAKDKAVSGMTSVGRGIIGAFGKPIRGVKKGINWVLGKLGAPKIKGTWGMKNVYAHGTDNHPGGLAIVGDGKGSNAGRELIQTGDTQFLSPNIPTMMNLPKGTSVFSARDTNEMLGSLPQYAKGTKGSKTRLDKMKEAYGTDAKDQRKNDKTKAIKSSREETKKKFGDIWDWMKKPKSLLKVALKTMGVNKPDEKGAKGRIARGGFKKAKEAMLEKIKSAFIEEQSMGGGLPGFGWPITSPFGSRIHPLTGRRTFHSGTDFGAPGGTPIPSQTAGNVSFSGWGGGYGNLVKVKSGIMEMLYAHMSKRKVKQGQQVSMGQILGLVGTTGSSTGNHLHYEVRKGGKPVDPMKLSAGGGGASGNVKSWISKALGITGSPKNWQGALETIAMKESGGKTGPSTVNKWDSNWRRGTPSMGLMQTIKPTFDAFKMPGFNNIMNPVHNAISAIRYIKSRYGNPFNTPGIKSMSSGGAYKGYEDGGHVLSKQLAWIAEGGWAESIISHDPSKKVRQEKIWNETGDKLGFSQSKVDDRTLQILERIAEAVEKDQDISLNLDGRKVAELIEPKVTKRQDRKAYRGRGVIK